LLNAIVLDQQAAATQALNASARARVATNATSNVTVNVNGTPVVVGLSPPNVGPYVLVPTGAVTVQVNGVDVTPVAPLIATPGADLTVLLTGSGPTMTLLTDDNAPSPSSVRPVKLRLVNGLNGTSSKATLAIDNAPVGNGADPNTASPYSQVLSSAGLARVEARVGTQLVYASPTTTLQSGRVYSLFLLGDLAQPTGILFPDR
jgi:hypothetical protein